MKSIEIENIKKFTSQLFAGTVFDDMLVAEALFCTTATFSIDGHINSGFVGEEEMKLPENQEGLVTWKRLKPICFEIIKGKKVPQRFKIVFKMSQSKVEGFIRESGATTSMGQIGGLFLNVNYQDGKLQCTTGVSLRVFTMDKSLDVHWDDYMTSWLKIFA